MSRCAHCKVRVGYLGYTCKCGLVFCSQHRYNDQHACTYDFKAEGIARIQRANPEVEAPKINKL